jgi:hypothetical protein
METTRQDTFQNSRLTMKRSVNASYLSYKGLRVDVTRSGIEPSEPIRRFLCEESICPDQIGSYKVELHQWFLRQWVSVLKDRDWEEIWRVREECIAALSE